MRRPYRASNQGQRFHAPPHWIVVHHGAAYRCSTCKRPLAAGEKAVYSARGIYCPDDRPEGWIEGVAPEGT